MVDSRRIEEEEEESSTGAKRRVEFRHGGLGEEKLDLNKYPPIDLQGLSKCGGVSLENFLKPTVAEQKQQRDEYDAMYENLWPDVEPVTEDAA